MHVKGGGTVVDVTPAEREQWRAKIQPVWPTMVKEIGPEGEALFKQVEAGKGQCKG